MKRLLLLFLFFSPLTAYCLSFSDIDDIKNPRGYLFEIHGSNTIGASLAPSLVESWLAAHDITNIETQRTAIENEKIVVGQAPSGSQIKVFIAAHGSGTGFDQILNGYASIAAASRPAKSSENALFPDNDVTSNEHETVLAIDGIAVIVNPNLVIDSLTIEQVGQLFSGEISNWQQLGGPNLAVNVHARDNRSGTFDTFNALVLKRGFKLTSTARRYESNDELSDVVAQTPGAIGFTSLASIKKSKPLAIADGDSTSMLPIHTAIATEDYPLSRRLYLYQINSDNPFALDFLAFAKTVAGQNVVNNAGFVSQNLKDIPMTLSGELPAGYSFITEKSKRITTNFRFREDGKKLDNKALDDLQRLAEFMSRPENENRKLLLIGFASKQRDEFKARLLSEARVITVKRELAKLGVTAAGLTGYGEINPVATNSDPKYALRNQRVEVWIR